MNKKVVGGLLAVLFVTSMVQTSAILKMQKVASAPRVQNVAMAPVEDYQYDFNQQAAVGVYDTTPSDPTPQGITILVTYGENNRCYVTIIDGQNVSVSNGTTVNNVNGNPIGCNLGLITAGDGAGTVSVLNNQNNFTITGSTSVLDAQFKLKTLGYFSGLITGKMDAATQSALKAFQTANKISATGTYGPQTKAAIDAKISGVRGTDVTGTSFTFTK